VKQWRSKELVVNAVTTCPIVTFANDFVQRTNIRTYKRKRYSCTAPAETWRKAVKDALVTNCVLRKARAKYSVDSGTLQRSCKAKLDAGSGAKCYKFVVFILEAGID
jgi:hypothetical protein